MGGGDGAGYDSRVDVPGVGDWGYTDMELECKHVRRWCIEGEMIPGISTSGILTARSLFRKDRQKGRGSSICFCFLLEREQSWARSRRVGDERTCVESERGRQTTRNVLRVGPLRGQV